VQTGPAAPNHYSALIGTALDTTPGTLRETGRPLDVALPEGTYLSLQTNNGEQYCRGGSLRVGANGFLQTSQGAQVIDAKTQKPIKADPNTEVSIDSDGVVKSADGDAIGKLKISSFSRPDLLQHLGNSMYAATPVAGAATPSTQKIEVGALEESNASVVNCMTDLMTANRSFEAFTKAISEFNEIDRKVVTTVPSV
jgi:flagellar basal body rod protein FlgG